MLSTAFLYSPRLRLDFLVAHIANTMIKAMTITSIGILFIRVHSGVSLLRAHDFVDLLLRQQDMQNFRGSQTTTGSKANQVGGSPTFIVQRP